MISPFFEEAVNISKGIFPERNQEQFAECQLSEILFDAICLFDVSSRVAAWIVVLHGLSHDTVVSPLQLESLPPEHDARL